MPSLKILRAFFSQSSGVNFAVFKHGFYMIEATTGGVLWKKLFFEISQNLQEKTCARVSFSIKAWLWQRWFPMNFAKFLRTPFSQNTSGRLLLIWGKSFSSWIIAFFFCWTLVAKMLLSGFGLNSPKKLPDQGKVLK